MRLGFTELWRENETPPRRQLLGVIVFEPVPRKIATLSVLQRVDAGLRKSADCPNQLRLDCVTRSGIC